VARVPGMQVRFIRNLKTRGGKCHGQRFDHSVASGHVGA
jgi:hypothetical protein